MSSASAQSLVAVPFLSEAPDLVARTLIEALSHPATAQVLGISGDDATINSAVTERVGGLSEIRLVPQHRIGQLRPGKGDAINTGLRIFLDETGYRRLHFYDADIRTFDRDWIERAELALDQGYDAVRHFYPRSPTDGMITWMITKPGFGLLWPDSVLPWIEQPMSGEVAFDREAAAILATDPVVVAQSDWGIDTVITHRSVAHGFSIYETFAGQGKDHQLYGSLEELRTMLLECLHSLQRLRTASPPQAIRYTAESASNVTPAVTRRVAYDIAATRELALRPWSPDELSLVHRHFNKKLEDLDTANWLAVLRVLLENFDAPSPEWQEVAFRLWVRRVLTYSDLIEGYTYEAAMSYLQAIVAQSGSS
ncbi:MAG: mannosylglycerate synthase domain-containing protein [Acidimicrobiia bacterium]